MGPMADPEFINFINEFSRQTPQVVSTQGMSDMIGEYITVVCVFSARLSVSQRKLSRAPVVVGSPINSMGELNFRGRVPLKLPGDKDEIWHN